jgi:hypothetical protein
MEEEEKEEDHTVIRRRRRSYLSIPFASTKRCLADSNNARRSDQSEGGPQSHEQHNYKTNQTNVNNIPSNPTFAFLAEDVIELRQHCHLHLWIVRAVALEPPLLASHAFARLIVGRVDVQNCRLRRKKHKTKIKLTSKI